jgi:hypothetical protein
VPDAKQDPRAALLYSAGSNFKSATFTYDMNMTMSPADDTSATALGPAAGVLSQMAIKGKGSGAMQVVDAAQGKTNLQMSFDMGVMGQQVKMDMIMLDGQVWTRIGEDGAWEKAQSPSTAAKSMGGMDPSSMMESYRDAVKVEWLDDKPLNGEAVHHLRYQVDPSKMDMSSVLASAEGGKASPEQIQAMLKEMSIDAEVWLTAKDLATRQTKMQISFIMPMPGQADLKDVKLKVVMDMTMAFDKINQAVEIKAPVTQ